MVQCYIQGLHIGGYILHMGYIYVYILFSLSVVICLKYILAIYYIWLIYRMVCLVFILRGNSLTEAASVSVVICLEYIY